jgi:16S rRNA (guanine966-N2)-methyltransferase
MRIIAGEFRGRRLLPPEGDTTRPITDRVKQSLFDILASHIDGANVYDCFAGTGSMGLECLSRGAAFVTFFEADRSALKRLEKNIATLDVGDSSKVISGDLFRWFEARADTDRTTAADLIFLDPPYRFLRERPEDLRRLATRFAESHLKPGGTVIFRHDANDQLELAPLARADLRTYGGMTLEFLQSAALSS